MDEQMAVCESELDDNFIFKLQAIRSLTRDTFEYAERHLGPKISRQILLLFGSFLHLNYFDQKLEIKVINYSPEQDQGEQPSHQQPVDLNDIDHWGTLRARLVRLWGQLTRLHALLFFVSFAWTVLSVIHQYKYDAVFIKLDQMKQYSIAQNYADYDGYHSRRLFNGNQSIVEQVEKELGQLETSLRSVGAPFMNAHFGIEVGYIYVLVIVVATYFQGIIQYNLLLPFNFPLARLILDPGRECASMSRLIVRELINFHQSSKNYIKATYFAKYICNHGFECPENIDQVDELNEHNREILGELYSMARSGSLQPLGWSRSFVFKLADYYGIFVLVSVVYVLLSQLVFATYLLLVAIKFDLKTGPMDLAVSGLVTLLVIYAISAIVYYASFVLFHSLMQIYYINSLIDLIDRLVHYNELNLIQLLGMLSKARAQQQQQQPRQQCRRKSSLAVSVYETMIETIRKQMNSNLLFAFIHFKTFVTQFEHSKEACSATVLTATGLFFLLPSIARLHMPYMDSGGHEMRSTVIGVSLTTILLFNSATLPVCYFHSRSLRLYKSLNSLMAHTIETIDSTIMMAHNNNNNQLHHQRQQPQLHRSMTIYNKHLVWLLRKELNHSAILSTQFAIESCGLKFTYPSVVRIHFYFGIVVLSIISTIGLDKEAFFGEFLNDPFGLFIVH